LAHFYINEPRIYKAYVTHCRTFLKNYLELHKDRDTTIVYKSHYTSRHLVDVAQACTLSVVADVCIDLWPNGASFFI